MGENAEKRELVKQLKTKSIDYFDDKNEDDFTLSILLLLKGNKRPIYKCKKITDVWNLLFKEDVEYGSQIFHFLNTVYLRGICDREDEIDRLLGFTTSKSKCRFGISDMEFDHFEFKTKNQQRKYRAIRKRISKYLIKERNEVVKMFKLKTK